MGAGGSEVQGHSWLQRKFKASQAPQGGPHLESQVCTPVQFPVTRFAAPVCLFVPPRTVLEVHGWLNFCLVSRSAQPQQPAQQCSCRNSIILLNKEARADARLPEPSCCLVLNIYKHWACSSKQVLDLQTRRTLSSWGKGTKICPLAKKLVLTGSRCGVHSKDG